MNVVLVFSLLKLTTFWSQSNIVFKEAFWILRTSNLSETFCQKTKVEIQLYNSSTNKSSTGQRYNKKNTYN